MLPDGTYTARVKSWSFKNAKTGTEYLDLLFYVPAAQEAVRGRLFFTEKSSDRSLEALRNCGWDGVDFGDLAGLGSEDVEIVVGSSEYNGQVKAEVHWINPIGGGPQKEMAEKDRRAFVARMNAKVRQQQGKPTAPKAPEEPPPPSDDDIPF